MLIKLSGGFYLAADDILSVTVDRYGTSITVQTNDGVTYCHEPAYGQDICETLDNLVKRFKSATTPQQA